MSVAYPSCLYIRVERDLRAALLREAMTAGLTVSELARRRLRGDSDPSQDTTGRRAASSSEAAI